MTTKDYIIGALILAILLIVFLLSSKLSELRKYRYDCDVELDKTRGNLSTAEQKLDRTIFDLSESRNEIRDIRNDLSRKNKELEDLNNEKARVENQVADLRRQIAEMPNNNNDENTALQIRILSQSLDSLNAQRIGLQREIAEEKSRSEALWDSLRTRERAYNTVLFERNNLEEQNENLQQRNASLTSLLKVSPMLTDIAIDLKTNEIKYNIRLSEDDLTTIKGVGYDEYTFVPRIQNLDTGTEWVLQNNERSIDTFQMSTNNYQKFKVDNLRLKNQYRVDGRISRKKMVNMRIEVLLKELSFVPLVNQTFQLERK